MFINSINTLLTKDNKKNILLVEDSPGKKPEKQLVYETKNKY